jgi:GH25 family lysozyme M1 (1,4-beta-N-acetylmuramidase)
MRRVGYYHFLNLGAGEPDAVAQAQHFLRTVGPLERGEFLAMDFEERGLPRRLVLEGWQRSLDELERATGRVPYIYTSKSLTDSYDVGDAFVRYPLWVVSLRDTPSLPAGWPTFAIWQFSFRGSVPGITGNVDLNLAPSAFVARRVDAIAGFPFVFPWSPDSVDVERAGTGGGPVFAAVAISGFLITGWIVVLRGSR